MKIYYENILVGSIVTNQSMTVDAALNLIGFDEKEFINENGLEDIDFDSFSLKY